MDFYEYLEEHPKLDKMHSRWLESWLWVAWWHIKKFFRFRRNFLDWRFRRQFKPGVFYEDCAYRPMILIEVREKETLRGITLTDGIERWCDLWHCGPEIVSEEYAKKSAEKLRAERKEKM